VYSVLQVIKALSGPPNNWDRDRVEKNFLKRLDRMYVNATVYDPNSIMHYR